MAILYDGKTFDAKRTKDALVEWVRDWFNKNGPESVAVFGASGGKDSTIAGAILKEALGKDRVMAVLMPNGVQPDINDSYEVVKSLNIPHVEINIATAYDGIIGQLLKAGLDVDNPAMKQNLAPRLRMSTLYAVAQTMNGRVVNTCNLSEDYVGYSTRYGDSVGDFSPLSNFTVTELLDIGRLLKLPEFLVKKTPSDGLCGQSDEEKLGFTYAVLDRYIRTKEIDNEEIKELIDKKHKQNLFKLQLMESFTPFGREEAE